MRMVHCTDTRGSVMLADVYSLGHLFTFQGHLTRTEHTDGGALAMIELGEGCPSKVSRESVQEQLCGGCPGSRDAMLKLRTPYTPDRLVRAGC